MNEYLIPLLCLMAWWISVLVFLSLFQKSKLQQLEHVIEKTRDNANAEIKRLIDDANNKREDILKHAKEKEELILTNAKSLEEKLTSKEEKLDKKFEEITNKQEQIFEKEEKLEKEKLSLKDKELVLENKLSEMSKLSEDEAKDLFMKEIEDKYEKDAVSLLQKRKSDLKKREKDEAREILLKAVQRYAYDVTSDITSTVIPLESDDIKWRLIWKEWRNIVTFEKETWVSLIIDDTPDTVFISSFDLYRRYIAKVALEKLLEDKRIQPARIEEIVASTNEEAEVLLLELGQKALEDIWLGELKSEITKLIWKLRFRTSYGQNILKHSIEVAYIAEALAKDLWADVNICKLWGLLHDLGKALDHDIEWTHPEIGARVWRKYGLDERVVDIIENHHGEPTVISLEAAVVQLADAISSIRPWARRESIEIYLKRVKELEAIAQSFSGVNKAYAVSAWREIRVFVDAEVVNDVEAIKMARDLAQKIEENLDYSGEVKINLIRESRVIEYAK